ncbi:MAG TPA: hypothetical protein VK978_01700 [Candidatus Saccharimonadales bacterium]|nr:hypothetical protein [Candidatus Saccharimonadales bacterium]
MSESNTRLQEQTQKEQNEQLLAQSELGALLVDGYHTALELDPRLAEMKVMPIEDNTHRVAFAGPKWAKKNESGKHEVHVRLGSLDDELDYIGTVMSRIPTAYEIMSKRMGIKLEQATPQLMYAHAIFHEMGHVVQFFDNENDPEAYQRMRKKDRLALPISNATALAIVTEGTPARRYVDSVWDQVQDQLGVTELDELVHLQAVAYRDMTAEAGADNFAADVFRMNPLLMNRLMSPNLNNYRGSSDLSHL